MFFTDGEPKKSSDHLVNADAAAKKKITAMIDAAKASGKSDPVPAVKAALAMKPDILYLLLDQVPDGDALVKAVKAGDPDKVTRISVLFFVTDVDDEDPKQTATVEALSQAVKFSGGQFRKILKADTANVAPAGPVVFALSNSGSMLAVIGHERLDIAKAVGELPVGTKFDVIVFADGKSTAMTDAPAASDGKSKGATDDFLIANPAGATANPSPA
jgi:hypothetical protein